MKEPLIICPVCGKEFKARLNRGKRQVTCSKECGYKISYPKGNLNIIASKNGMTKKQFMELINKEHNINNLSIKEIAEKYEIVRITLMRWCKKYGIKTRSISEDNKRRYAKMTDAQKKEQVKNANIGIRNKFKDPLWKENQIRKIHEAQNFIRSKPELLFEKLINEKGYFPIAQYSKDLAGFILDFAFPDIKLAIEIDGEYWHNLENTKKKDRRRNYYLEVKKGWEVIHIPSNAFMRNPEHYMWEVIQTIEVLKIA